MTAYISNESQSQVNVAALRQQADAAQARWLELQQAVADQDYSPDLLQKSLQELSVSLEELQVAVEEMQIQNQDLLAARHIIESERQRYQELFELAPDGYLITDLQGTIQSANLAAAKLLNIGRAAFAMGKPLTIFVAQPDRRKFLNRLEELTRSKQVQDWELLLQPRDREAFPVSIAVSLVENSLNQSLELWWMIRDITDRKQAERDAQDLEVAQKLGEFKSHCLRAASHELRTPLNLIFSASVLLEQYSENFEVEEKKKLLKKIQGAARQMGTLIDEVLISSQSEIDGLTFKPSLFNLKQFCQRLIEEHQATPGSARPIRIHYEGERDAVCMDQRLLRQILSNLLTNALKYSPSDSPIDLELEINGDQLVCRVRDWGVGIPAVDQPQLFAPFYRASNVEAVAGNGLGLAIVKKAVDLHGGTIAIESKVGVGSTFTVMLPTQYQK